MTRSPDLGAFCATLGSTSLDSASARSTFVGWLVRSGIDDEAVDELAVVFSELASNAVRAGTGSTRPATVEARTAPTCVTIDVTNPLPAEARPTTHWDLADPLRGGGPGLMIVRAYSDDVTVHRSDAQVTISCRRDLDRCG